MLSHSLYKFCFVIILQCLTEEILEKSTDSFLASQTVSPSHLAQIQVRKEK